MNKLVSATFAVVRSTVKKSSFEAFSDLETYLPAGVTFDEDTWAIQSWQRVVRRGGTLNLFFGKIRHQQLRSIIKCYALYSKKIGTSSTGGNMPQKIKAASVLGEVLQARPVSSITTADVMLASERLRERVPAYTRHLATIATHLNTHYGLKITYRPPKIAGPAYGTHGSDIERATKLISDQVLMDLLALNFRDNISEGDRLFISAIALNVTCGWRISELVTLPLDCLIEDERALFVRGYPSKGGKPAPKLVPSHAEGLVLGAYASIRKITDEGRAILKEWIECEEPDWSRVVKHDDALRYFAQKSLHEWGMRPENRLINPDAAWHRDRGWIDVLSVLDKHPHRQSASVALGLSFGTFDELCTQQREARAGRLWTRLGQRSIFSWMKDRRVLDRSMLMKLYGFADGRVRGAAIDDLLEEAARLQTLGTVIANPEFDEFFEKHFARARPLLLRSAGKPILYVDDALFVLPKRYIGSQATQKNDWQMLTTEHLAQWLSGQSGYASVFKRYGIVDERTGEPARFTSHDIRHWLDTQWQRGGMTNAQIATLMNRKDPRGNSIYNQMSNAERRALIVEGVRDGVVSGHMAEVVSKAEMTKEEAEQYVTMQLRQINVMPHGLCIKDLATEACPHNMSCFVGEAEAGDEPSNDALPCHHLLYDLNSSAQREGIRIENLKARAMCEMLEDDEELQGSPQIKHYSRLANTTARILAEFKG
ncbi:hypothetical protein [Brucella pseudogrignonensis]|uniref:hypothetical protein n=1 Tax=Brucella pseudogrignonensis TaxID=419475 RepID=UPI0038CF75E4